MHTYTNNAKTHNTYMNMHAHIYTYKIHMCTYIHSYVCMHTYACIPTCIHTHTHISPHMHIHWCNTCIYIHSAYTSMHIHACTYAYIHGHPYMHICIYTHTYMCIHTYSQNICSQKRNHKHDAGWFSVPCGIGLCHYWGCYHLSLGYSGVGHIFPTIKWSFTFLFQLSSVWATV